jgi:hypothetical protein
LLAGEFAAAEVEREFEQLVRPLDVLGTHNFGDPQINL